MFKISKRFKKIFLTVATLVQIFKTFFEKTIDKFKNTVYNQFNKTEQEEASRCKINIVDL